MGTEEDQLRICKGRNEYVKSTRLIVYMKWKRKREDEWIQCSGNMKRMDRRRIPRRDLKFEGSARYWKKLREERADNKGRE
jgi:hypothetical protein